jgi:hypothetical protein
LSRPRLLDALAAALDTALDDDFRHHSPPAVPLVATAKPLSGQGFRHLRHFRHLNRDEPAGSVLVQIDPIAADRDSTGKREVSRKVSLLKEIGGESGESRKTEPITTGYVSPPAREVVANGGESGEKPGRAARLLAHLGQILLPQPLATDAAPPASSVAGWHDRLNRWLAAHLPPPCPADQCACCGGYIDARASDALPVIRALTPVEPIWLHLRCYPDWHEQRVAAARAALAALPVARDQVDEDGDGR